MVDDSGNIHADDGNALFDGDVVAYSSTIASDARLKENVEDLNYGLKDVLDIRPVSFDWKEKETDNTILVL